MQLRLSVPLFYFHIVAADATFLDEDGVRFADREAALAHARNLMTELARSLQTRDGTIVVENDDDGELFEVPLSDRPN
ncbi:MAG: hypothetical protein JWQ94_2923 [Tardiphaga sp.]|nr:hypothetical protein [Tardiphaga sp.]